MIMAEHRWYAIQTTAGHENKVRSLIQRKIDADARTPEERSTRQALVPTQEEWQSVPADSDSHHPTRAFFCVLSKADGGPISAPIMTKVK